MNNIAIHSLRVDEIDREDITILANQMRDYYHQSDTMIEIDIDNTKKSFKTFLIAGFAGIMVLEESGIAKGLIGGFKSPDPLSGKVVANEVFWYVDKDCRKKGYGKILIDAFEKWAIDRGCCVVRLSHLIDLRANENKLLYEGSGYKACEIYYEKGIK